MHASTRGVHALAEIVVKLAEMALTLPSVVGVPEL